MPTSMAGASLWPLYFEEDFDRLGRPQLVEFYERYYRQGRFVMFVAGKLPADLESMLNEYFGDLGNQAGSLPPLTAQPSVEKKFRVINDPDGVQGAIRIARPFQTGIILIS